MDTRTRLLAAAIAALLAGPAAWASVPTGTTYQGLLLDAGGNPLNDTISMTARLWDDPVSTSAANLLYEETHGAVDIVDGVFELTLGRGSATSGAFDASLFGGDPDRWLEIEAAGELLSPRQQLFTVAYSFQSQECLNASTLEGFTASEIVQDVVDHLTFAAISGVTSDAQIPGGVARDAEVFGIVLSNDGPGSQLDADFLDGQSVSDIIAAARAGLGFSDLAGVAADGQVPGTIARDAEVMGLVLSQDGPGSGLNADLIDGLTGSELLTTSGGSVNGTLTADVFRPDDFFRVHHVPGNVFVPALVFSDEQYFGHPDGYGFMIGGDPDFNVELFAPVQLPAERALLRNLNCQVYRANTGTTVRATARLHSRATSSTAATTHTAFLVEHPPALAGLQVATGSPVGSLIYERSQRAYWISLVYTATPSASARFYGCWLEYDPFEL